MKRLASFLAAMAMLAWAGLALDEPLRITENLRHEKVILPLSIPERNHMARVDAMLFVEADGAGGVLFFYDDPNTKAPVDYIEFYDPEGHLLLVSWIDRLGICQAAMDRGLLDAKNPRVEKILTIVALGTQM